MARPEHEWSSKEYSEDWVSKDDRRAAEREAQFSAALRWFKVLLQGPTRVCDVGCGPGTLGQRLLGEFPELSMICSDGSPDMLNLARERLKDYGERASYIQADFGRDGWTADLPSDLNGVISARAIHNLRKLKPIGRVYKDIFDILRPGGFFMNIERVNFASEFLHQKFREIQVSERGKAPGMDGAGPSLAQQFQLLKRAGFSNVDCPWRDGNTAIVLGFKAAESE